MSETYTRINWKDGENGGTPISADNLNLMDLGIEKAHQLIEELKENGVGGVTEEQLKNAVDAYFIKNPIQTVSDIFMRVSDGYIQFSTDNLTWKNVIAVSDISGDDGKTAYEYAKDGGYTGTEEEFAQKLAKEIKVDSELSEESENPVQNKVVAQKFSQLSDTIANLKENGTGTAEVNNIKGKKWVCFGDSLTDMSYSYRTVIEATKQPIISNQGYRSGMTMSWGRGALCALDYLTFGIYGAKWEWDTDYKPDFVTVCFGVNDWFYNAPLGSIEDDNTTQTEESYTFYGCYCNFIRAIYNKWGFVPIFLLAPPSYTRGYSKNSAGHTALDYTNAVIEIGEYFNLPVFDLYSETHMLHGSAYNDVTSDGTHWNSRLVDMLSYRIFDFINSKTGTLSITSFTVTNNLTNVTNSNGTSVVIQGTDYVGVISANTGYALESVQVIYDGEYVTESVYNSSTGEISISSVQGDISITASATMLDEYATVTNNLTNVINSNKETATLKGGSYNATITVSTGCVMENVTITMNGTDITNDCYNSETGEISIFNVTGNIIITATATAVNYTITNTLTNATNSNTIELVSVNSVYNATISASAGYDITDINITMGGVDITDEVYNSETGEVSISSVTGNVVITVFASEHQEAPIYSLENHTFDGVDDYIDTGIAPLSTDSDWTIAYKLGDIITPETTRYAWYIDNNNACSPNKSGVCNNIMGGSNFYSDNGGQVRIVVTHKAGELTLETRGRNSTQTIQLKTITISDINKIISSSNLVLGAATPTSAYSAFTCRAFKVWDCVITDSQAEDFLNNW